MVWDYFRYGHCAPDWKFVYYPRQGGKTYLSELWKRSSKVKTRFETFCEQRQRAAGKKYIMENGENQGLYRNGLQDIMEELADAHNILRVFIEKYVRKQGVDKVFLNQAIHVLDKIEEVANNVDELNMLDGVAEIAKDDIPINRTAYFKFSDNLGLAALADSIKKDRK